MQRAKKAVEALDIVGAVVATDYRYDLHGIRLHGEEWVITFARPVFYNHRGGARAWRKHKTEKDGATR